MTPSETVPPERVQAAFAATLVDEWVRCGLTDAVVAPGSRSTPLVLALADNPAVRAHVHLDERSAAFMALGLGLATMRPAVVVTTSGTAAAHLHPAVLEAHHARVPLVVCTADRPPHLHHVGAPQTVEQAGLFGAALRWGHDPGLAAGIPQGTWRSLAARSWAEAVRATAPGPVHLNIPFDEPLVAEPAEMAPGRAGGRAWFDVSVAAPDPRPRFALPAGAGVIVAGNGCGAEVVDAAVALGWPVLADPRSGIRGRPNVVSAFDPILRAVGGDLRPRTVVRIGDPPASKVLAQWLASLDAFHAVVDPSGAFADPDRSASLILRTTPEAACRSLSAAGSREPPGWLERWMAAEASAQAAIARVTGGGLSEPAVARVLTEALPAEAILLVASSMPIRDTEWFGHPDQRVRVVSNRGANGIDGTVSTAVGLALSGKRVFAHLGDLAFLHDSNGLLGLRERGVSCTFVVVDNGGGGIFSFLPQAATLQGDRFERFFATPQPVDICALAGAHGIRAEEVTTVGDLRAALDGDGVSVVVVRSERRANVDVHDALNRAVASALNGGN